MLALKLLLVILLANGAPILAHKWLGTRWQWPVDCDRRSCDGRPWFGRSKTWRGLVVATTAGVFGAYALGLTPGLGLCLGAGAMAGDLLSSFLKRRLGIPPSGMALGLDQVPEVLFPLLLVREPLALQAGEIAGVTAAFFVCELLLSRLLFRLHIRNRPY